MISDQESQPDKTVDPTVDEPPDWDGNEENEDDSTAIYSVSTVSRKTSDIGFGF